MSEPRWVRQLLTSTGQEQPDETGEKILEAARELFLSFGLRKTSIEDIAKKAGIGRPTLYRRFSDKDAIIQAVLARESRFIVTAVAQEVSSISHPQELLLKAFVTATQLVSSHPLTRRLLDTEPELILPFLTIRGGSLIDAGHLLAAPTLPLVRKAFPEADEDMLLEILGRLFMSAVITPTSLVPVGDTTALESMVRQVLR